MPYALCDFFYLNVLFGRVFNCYSSIGTDFHTWLSGSVFISWLAIIAASGFISHHAKGTFALSAVLLSTGFILQTIAVLPASATNPPRTAL